MEHGAVQLAKRLCRALRGQDDAMAAGVLWEGADPNLVLPEEGLAPMHLAAGLEQENGVRGLLLLLQHGGDPNVRSGEGLTPLHVAASWGCTACLRLLLTEGGDPHLQDQEGNTAFDLAVEHGNETCVHILQDGGWNCSFPQRRAESFMSTVMEDAGETGPGDSLPYPSGRLSLSSLKEARLHGDLPPGTVPQPGVAVPNSAPVAPRTGQPCTEDRSASSFLTEGSWRDDTILDMSDSSVRPVASPKASPPARGRASSRADVQIHWGGEVGRAPLDAGMKLSWDSRAPAEGGCSPDTPPGAPFSFVGSKAPSFGPDASRGADSPPKAPPSASLRSAPEAAHLRPPLDACGPPQECVSLDPLGLLVPIQEGADVTCLGHLAESTTVSDLGTMVADQGSVLWVSGTLDGCPAKGRSPDRCSVASMEGYLSCMSECYASAVEGPGCSCVHEWEEGLVQGSKASSGGSCGGPPACNGMGLPGQRTTPNGGPSWLFPGSQELALPHSKRGMTDPPEKGPPWGWSALATEGPPEARGLPVVRQGPAPSGVGAERAEGTGGGLPRWAPWAGEGPLSSSTQDTVPVQWPSEERNRFGPLGPSSPVGSTEVAPCPPASLGEELHSTLDAQLRSMMLATRAAHSPLPPSNQKGCPAAPWPQSPPMGPLPQQSLSASSLFDEPLEMPSRPRRVRRGPGPTSLQGAATLSRLGRGAEEAGKGRIPLALPSCRKPSLHPGPGSWGGSLASPGGDRVGGGEGPSRRAGEPSLGEAPQGCPEVGPLGARGSQGKRVEKTSTVSFSQLPGRDPSAPCPPGGLEKPTRQEVPLSPGGRPVNLSTTEPVEFLYVDEEEGQTLIERHLPPTDDSGSSSEETLLGDWQEGFWGREGAPLNPEHLTDQALACRLRELGANPGPVTPLTRRLYEGLLERLSRDPETPARRGSADYSPELASALRTYRIPPSKADEMALAAEFDQPDKSRRWREGLLKSSFNYLLLDPRVTQNLPARCQLLSPAEAFQTFIRAIFYVGKGTRGRPYRHLYEALNHYREGQGTLATQVSSKVQHILEIWAEGRGVVSMHCFQNVVPVEAYTREACMVDAIGLKMLTNQKKGNYYGLVASWPTKRRRSLGVFLLHRALHIFLAEGERQLRPADI